MAVGGSGVCRTVHVRLMVDPAWINSSGPLDITVSGSSNNMVVLVFAQIQTK